MITLLSISCGERSAESQGSEFLDFARKFSETYPKSEAQDLYKTLFQESFGPGHIISSWDAARLHLERELASMPPHEEVALIEPCGPAGRMLRLNLRSALAEGIDVDDIIDMMRKSVERLQPDTLAFLHQGDIVRRRGADAQLPCTNDLTEKCAATLGPEGLDVIHHSDVYVMNYRPAYRVIMREVYNEWSAREVGRLPGTDR